MAIRKASDSVYTLECDECGDESDETFYDFYEAVEYKKDRDNGWLSTKDADDVWKDLCPSCKQPFLREKYK